MVNIPRAPVRASSVLLLLTVGAWTGGGPDVARSALVINELLPDPEGADSGREFVELLNTGEDACSLLDIVLEFGNGAVADDWRVRWTGGPTATVGPGRRYLIVDRNWQGSVEAQAEVTLGLQNGPDAIRIRRGEVILDMVGYGPLTDPDMLETEAVAVTPGASLARRPDGRDTDCNAADFFAAVPTPGAINFLPRELTLSEIVLNPPSLGRPGQDLQLTVTLLNSGTETLPTGTISLQLAGRVYTALWDACPPEHHRSIVWQTEPAQTGRWPLQLGLALTDPDQVLELTAGEVQVGPGPLCLNEVLAAPGQGQGEWVELQAVTELSLSDFVLRDEDGPWRSLPPVDLAAGQFVVLAEDAPALAAWHAENLTQGGPSCAASASDLLCLELPGAWPGLNNSPPAARDFADRLRLADTTGCVLDHVVLGPEPVFDGGPVVDGRTLERIAVDAAVPGSTNWSTCTAATGGTPACVNSVSLGGVVPFGLTVVPSLLDADAGVNTVHLRFRIGGAQQGWQGRIYDLWGDRVRDLGGDTLGNGPRDLLWDGRDDAGRLLPAGAYVVLLRATDAGGYLLGTEKVLVGIRPPAVP